MVPDKPQEVEKFHFTWCGHIGFRTRYYVKIRRESFYVSKVFSMMICLEKVHISSNLKPKKIM